MGSVPTPAAMAGPPDKGELMKKNGIIEKTKRSKQ
jgi:hypothetical protein